MENVLYKSIGDRSVDILRHIERYCLSENKNKLEVIRVVFDFLEGIKERLDDSFVRACLDEILRESDESTKKAYQYENARMIRDLILSNDDLATNFKSELVAIEGGKGNITALLCTLLTINKTEWEKWRMIKRMKAKAKNPLYIMLLTGLYTSKDSGVKIEYINHIGDVVTYIYSRTDFIQDIELVNAQYDDLVNEQKGSNINEERKQGGSTEKTSKQLTYKDIFRSPWKNQLSELEKILSARGYINKGQWMGESGKKSELAELYHYLKMKNIIAQGEEAKQLSALYSEFGLSVGKDNTRNGEYCTLRTLRKVNGDSDTKERFEQILKAWVCQGFTT